MPVNTSFLFFAADFVESRDEVGCFRLYAAPPATKFEKEKPYGLIEKGTPYRVCMAQSIWERRFLMKLLSGKLSAASFEIEGTKEAESYPEEIWGVREDYRPIVCLYSAITRGKWSSFALVRAREMGILVDTSLRSTEKS